MPSLSTSLANFSDYELAESSVAFDTATMMQLGFLMYPFIIFTTCYSISLGWSPIGFCLKPYLLSRFQANQQAASLKPFSSKILYG